MKRGWAKVKRRAGPSAYLCALRIPLLLLPLVLLLGYQSEAEKTGTVQVRDGLGRALRLPTHPRRVLALAPSITEILFAGADTATTVARCPPDNYPAGVYRKPVVNNYPLDLENLVLLGTTGRYNLLVCAVLGGSFVLVCDLLARLLYPPAGLPVGLVTALFGVPFFVYLLRRKSF